MKCFNTKILNYSTYSHEAYSVETITTPQVQHLYEVRMNTKFLQHMCNIFILVIATFVCAANTHFMPPIVVLFHPSSLTLLNQSLHFSFWWWKNDAMT